jgi:phage N-6-adenine-methyltransferase
MDGAAVVFSSARSDWRTPPRLFAALDAEFHFTVDVCATRENRLCERYIGPDHHDARFCDALLGKWGFAETCFMNPPYSRDEGIDIAPFIAKAYDEAELNTVVALVPARTDTRWWHAYVMRADEVRLIPHRIRFFRPNGIEADSAGFPSAVVIWSAAHRRPHITAWDY